MFPLQFNLTVILAQVSSDINNVHLQIAYENTIDLPSYLQQAVAMHILKAKLREQNPEVQQARACLVFQDLPVLSPELHWLKMLHLCSFLL